MAGLRDLFKRRQRATPGEHVRKVDRPMIGSELFPDGPRSPRDMMMPMRQRLQAEYRSEGRDPDTLAAVPVGHRDETFWMTYIDSLTVFERDEEALVHLSDVLPRYPGNGLLLELKRLIHERMD